MYVRQIYVEKREKDESKNIMDTCDAWTECLKSSALCCFDIMSE